MRLVRLLGNIILACAVLCIGVLILGTGYAFIATSAWEYEVPIQEGRENTWLQVNGLPVHLAVAGPDNGPVMILLHGSDIEGGLVYTPNIKPLARAGVRVIAIDFPGYGYSTRDLSLGYLTSDQARLLEQVIEALGVKQVTLVGFQRGCAVALAYALDHSQNVRQVALISPLVHYQAKPFANWLASMPVVGKALIWATTSGPLVSLQRQAFRQSPLTDEYITMIRGTTHITGTNAFQLTWMRDIRDDLVPLDDIVDLQIPTLILAGSESSQTAQEAESLAQTMADAKLTTFPGVGLYVHQEAADQVNSILVQFGLYGVR